MESCQTISKHLFSTLQLYLSELLEILPGIYLTCANKCFPQFWYGQSQSIIIFAQCSVEAFQTIWQQWLLCIFYNSTITVIHLKFDKCFQESIWHIKQKVFSFNFDISNLNPLSCLGNVQWKVVKQIEIVICIVLAIIIVLSLATCFNF